MHVFNDNGWFTGERSPRYRAHVYSGFRYQVIDIKSIPAHQVTKICFCGDHDDLIRLRIQLNEALKNALTSVSLPSTARKCYRWGAIKDRRWRY